MGIFTTRFINTFKESSLINNESSNYDVGYELCNISSLALNEYYNCQSLLESTIGDEKQQLYLEAKMDVLLEFSLKDIGEKIKNAFKWLWEKIKELGRWIKGLFTKSKAKETKENLNKAKTEAQKNPEKAKINSSKELENKIDSVISKDNPENIASAVDKAIKEIEARYTEEEKRAASVTRAFYKIMYDPMLYFEPSWFIRKDFIQNTNARLDAMEKALETFQRKDPSNDMGDTTDFNKILVDMVTLSAFSPEYMSRFPTYKELFSEKISSDGTKITLNNKQIKSSIMEINIENMKKENKQLSANDDETAMINMISWLMQKGEAVNNKYIKQLELLSKDVSDQINIVEKNIMGMIKKLSDSKSTVMKSGITKTTETYKPNKIQLLQDGTTTMLYQLKWNTAIVSSIYGFTASCLSHINKASVKIELLLGAGK